MAFDDQVRADENRARLFGISGVPCFAIDERYGLSGAQPPEVLLDALRRAWSEVSQLPGQLLLCSYLLRTRTPCASARSTLPASGLVIRTTRLSAPLLPSCVT